MPAAASLAERDCRILAGYRAGSTILELALAEEVDLQVIRRVLRSAGISPGTIRQAKASANADRLAGAAWPAAEYATKSARQIANELGCRRDAVYEALHAAGVKMWAGGYRPAGQEIPPETAERVVSPYRAGRTAKNLAAELGLQVKWVKSLVEAAGVKRSRSEVASLAHAARREPAGKKPAPKRANRWPSEQAAEVLGRYVAGESGEEIAESLGLTPTTVYRLLRTRILSSGSGVLRSRVETRRMGGAPKPVRRVRQELPAEVAEQAIECNAAGEPAKVVALALGVSAKRVYRLLRLRGVLRSKSEAGKMRRARRAEDKG